MLPGLTARRPASTGRKAPSSGLTRLGGLLGRRPSPKKGGGRFGTSTTSNNKTGARSPRQMNTTTQVILDKVPNFMDMSLASSLYYLPFSIHTAKIEVEWGKNVVATRSPHVDVEVSIAMFTWAGKRFDFVTNTRRTSKDKSITYIGEDTLSAFTAPAPVAGGATTASTPQSSIQPPSILKMRKTSVTGKTVSVSIGGGGDMSEDDDHEPLSALGPTSPSKSPTTTLHTSESKSSIPPTARQEYPSRETFQIKLHNVTSAVAYIAVVAYVKTPGKTLSDIKGPRSAVGDTCYYPDNPLLLRYDHSSGENNVPAVCSLLLASESLPNSTTTTPAAGEKEAVAATTTDGSEEKAKVLPVRKVNRNTSEPALPRLWTVRSPGFPLKGRNFRQISDELEHFIHAQLEESAAGSAKRLFDVGGDPSRVAAHRLSDRAWEIERGAAPVTAPGNPPRRPSLRPPGSPRSTAPSALSPGALRQMTSGAKSGASSTAKDGRGGGVSGRVSPDTESGSSDESGGEEAGDLFYVTGNQRTLQPPSGIDPGQRTRVVRKDTKSYSIGQGVRAHEADSDFDDMSDEDANVSQSSRPQSGIARRLLASSQNGSSIRAPHPPQPPSTPHNGVEDEALLESVFPHYVNPHITRYEPAVYNRGSHRQSLLEHYLRRKDTYDTMLAAMARTPKDPVTVKQVSNTVETEDDIEREQQRDPDALKPKLPAVMSDMIAASNQDTVNYLKLLASQQRQTTQKRGAVRPKSGARTSRLRSMGSSMLSPTRPSSTSSKVVRRPPSTSFSPRNTTASTSSWGGKSSPGASQWTTKPQ